MANYSITAIIGAVTDKLKKGLDSAVKSTKNYADKSEKSVGKVTKAGNKAATSLGGLGLRSLSRRLLRRQSRQGSRSLISE